MLALAIIMFVCSLANLGQTQGQQFSWPSYFADNMVLQGAPSQASVWGFTDPADAGSDVTVQVNGQEVTGSVGSDGIWQVLLEPVSEHGPFTVTATLGADSIQLNGVLFGDVYICSGQSNMVYRVKDVDDPQADLDLAPSYTQLRVFQIPLLMADSPQDDVSEVSIQWAAPTSENVAEFSAVCWFYGVYLYEALTERGLQRPLGLVQTAVDGARIEAWTSQDTLDECFPDGDVPPADGPNAPSVLYNAMLHPFLRMTIHAALWYQGESNAGGHDNYVCLHPSMINDWRRKWNQTTGGATDIDFPFGQVQLAPFVPEDIVWGFPNLRWAQTNNVGFTPNPALRHVFTAVAIDLADFDSPIGSDHPRYKRQISRRLLYGALSLVYGVDDLGPHQGPFPQTFDKVADDTVRITFDRPVSYRSPDDTIGHEVCCSFAPEGNCDAETGQWYLADVTDLPPGGTEVLLHVSCDPWLYVTGVRYAWRVSPCHTLEMCDLYDADNPDLPVPPYRFHQLIQ